MATTTDKKNHIIRVIYEYGYLEGRKVLKEEGIDVPVPFLRKLAKSAGLSQKI